MKDKTIKAIERKLNELSKQGKEHTKQFINLEIKLVNLSLEN